MPGIHPIHKRLLTGLLLLATSAWGGESAQVGFDYDPVLAGEQPLPAKANASHPLPVDATMSGGEVRLAPKMAVAPYVEAVRGQEPTADELRLLPDGYQRNPLEHYKLGAGIGVAVEDRANLTLGYRHHQPLSLLDDSRQPTTVGPRNDLRIFFDFKIPLD
jgi:hypothetical protein